MPKGKTRRAAKKRFRLTGTGKVVRRQAKTRHLLAWKPPSKKRRLRRGIVVAKAEARRIKSMLLGG